MSFPVLIFLSFIGSLALIKVIVFFLEKTHTLYYVKPHVKKFYVHHITTGIFIISAVGYILLTQIVTPQTKQYLAIIFSFGLALIADEGWMGLLLTSRYWDKQGKQYYKINSHILILLIIGVLAFLAFWS